MNGDTGKTASIRLSTQLLYFMDYKIHEYSPEQLYENKARLFESLMKEWNDMTEKEKEKYSQKVKFTKGGEKAKQRKDESALENLYENVIGKNDQISQPIIQEKSQRLETPDDNLSSELIKERMNSYELISEKETNSQQPPFKSQKSLNQGVIQEEQNDENKMVENVQERNENVYNLKNDNEEDQKLNIRQRKKPSLKSKKNSQKGTIDMVKPKRPSDYKKALSPSKQLQLEQQRNQKHFSIDQTLTLKQLKDQVKNFLRQNE